MSAPAERIIPRLASLGAAACALCSIPWASAQTPTATLPPVEVISVSPLPGLGVPRDQVPAHVQTATGAELERSHALDLTGYLNRTLGGVSINELQNNPFQPDVEFRGFTASPLLGTPQGLSVYLDGVRLNQPFGDVVSWDLIPRSAIASMALMPGSNPLFGLNTLGGALSLQTKDGLKYPGTSVQLLGGANHRAAAEFETGGSRADGLNWFVTGNRFHESGWRAASPSNVQQLFAKVGRMTADSDVSLTVALANNDLTGNGLQEAGALRRDRASVYTVPDKTRNQSMFVNLAATRDLSDDVTLSGNVYYRQITTDTYNGDVNDGAFESAVYQPDAAERAALAQAGYRGFPINGADAANTPFPKWRCIANALLNDEPDEKCNGLINRTRTRQHNFGLAGEIASNTTAAGLQHRIVLGAAFDASRVGFLQSAQFGYIEPDRSITPVSGPGAFADGTQSAGDESDARVDLSSRSRTYSVYASDTLAMDPRTHLTLAGRYNYTTVTSRDAIAPGGGSGSLDGRNRFSRFNPALGLTFAPDKSMTLYAGVNQGSRAPSAIELGCADPATPCKLPNSFAGDPPLEQVVTTTFEAGLRGGVPGQMAWNVGVFRADNRNDLLFVSDNTSGFGYFRNFGKTRRQGLEMGLSVRPGAGWLLGGNLTLLDATYRSAEEIDGSANSGNDSALAGFPGTAGRIHIRPGDRIPLLPQRVLKLFAQRDFNPRWSSGADLIASSGAPARGNENGLHRPDGVFYTGPGRSAGYAVLNLNAEYRPTPKLKVFVQINNVLDRRYSTGAQLGANGFDANGNFRARAFGADANGDYPVSRGTFFAPGAPRTAWIGVRYTFN